MKPKQTFTKQPYTYNLVHSTVTNKEDKEITWAVYEQKTTWEGETEETIVAYEIHKLRPNTYHPIYNKDGYVYKHPSNSDWGYYGWTCTTKEQMEKKLQELTQ